MPTSGVPDWRSPLCKKRRSELMPEALRLSEFDDTRTLSIECRRCERSGRLWVRTLKARYGADAALPDVANALSEDCPRHGAYGGCFVYFSDLNASRPAARCLSHWSSPVPGPLRPALGSISAALHKAAGIQLMDRW